MEEFMIRPALITLVFWVAMFIVSLKDFDMLSITPSDVHNCNNVNWFGAVVLWLLFFVINPFFFIAHFIVWIFTVGRD